MGAVFNHTDFAFHNCRQSVKTAVDKKLLPQDLLNIVNAKDGKSAFLKGLRRTGNKPPGTIARKVWPNIGWAAAGVKNFSSSQIDAVVAAGADDNVFPGNQGRNVQ